MPYFPYSRQSKKKSHRGAITARMVANLLNVAGVSHVITLDLHASQMQGYFKCPVDNLIAEPFIARWIRQNVPKWQEAVVVSKNPGGTKRVTSLADALKLSFGIVTTDSRRKPLHRLQDLSMNGSVIFENYGSEDAEDDDERHGKIIQHPEQQINGFHRLQIDTKYENKEPQPKREHRRTISNSQSYQTQNASIETPSSPVAKSTLPNQSPSETCPNRSTHTNSAPQTSAQNFEAGTEEFIDERARDVIHGRLIQGHIVDDDAPSPAFSSVSTRDIYRNSHQHHGSDEGDTPPNMAASLLSTTSSLRRGEGSLGGSVGAASTSDEEEEELKNPELETTITLVGDVRDRLVFIVDDSFDKSGSWIAAAECCVKRGGATRVYCIATHGLFGDECLEEMEECDCIDRIVVTNSFPIPEMKTREGGKLTVLDMAPLLAEAIRRNHYGENLSPLYMHDSWN